MIDPHKTYKFLNIERGRLKNELFFKSVRYAYGIFGTIFIVYYLSISFLTTALLALSALLVYFRVTKYKYMDAVNDILALQVGPTFLLLDTARGDFPVYYSDIDHFLIKPDEQIKNYFLTIKLNKDVEIEWPEELIENHNLRIPGVFEEDLFYIINHSESLKTLCRNYTEAKSFLEYDHELRVDSEV